MLRIPDRRTKKGRRDHALLVLMANTPLRKIEICGLRRRDLVRRGGQCLIEYRAAKRRREVVEVVPVAPAVAEVLDGYCRNEQTPEGGPMLLTMGKHGPYARRGITGKAIDLVVRKYAGLAGIAKRVTPHSFRASYATRALESGMDVKTVSMLLGQASAASAEPYLRSNLERMGRVAEVFGYV